MTERLRGSDAEAIDPYALDVVNELIRRGSAMAHDRDMLRVEVEQLREFAQWARGQFHVLDNEEGYQRASEALDA